MKASNFLIAISSFLFLVSCSKNESENPEDKEPEPEIELTLSIDDVSNVSYYQADVVVTVTIENASFDEIGVCWDVFSGPDIAGDHLIMENNTGSLNWTIDNLEDNTKYFIRAYGIVNGDVHYSNQRFFITKFLFEEYMPKYMYGTTVFNFSETISLEYDEDNRIIKRNGGVIKSGFDPSVGYELKYTTDLSDTIIYDQNHVVISQRNAADISEVYDRKYHFNSDGLITRKIEFTGNESLNDTTDYFYSSSGHLERSELRTGGETIESNYYFNGGTNLDSIVTKNFWEDGEFINKRIYWFRNYDNAPNPIKGLIYFEDLFYRSHSENNFRSWETMEYRPNSQYRGINYFFGYGSNDYPLFHFP